MLQSLQDSDTENLPNRIHRKQANAVKVASEKRMPGSRDLSFSDLVFGKARLLLYRPITSPHTALSVRHGAGGPSRVIR